VSCERAEVIPLQRKVHTKEFFERQPISSIVKAIIYTASIVKHHRRRYVTRFSIFLIAAAFQHVRDNLDELEGANETDLVFLKGLLDNPAVKQLIQVSVYTSNNRNISRLSIAFVCFGNYHGIEREETS